MKARCDELKLGIYRSLKEQKEGKGASYYRIDQEDY